MITASPVAGMARRSGHDLLRETVRFANEDPRRSWLHFGSTLLILAACYAGTTLPLPTEGRAAATFLAGLVTVRMFILYHDYGHGAILRRSRFAKVFMTLFGILVLSPPSPWNLSHDYHHAHNTKLFGSSIGSYPIMTTEAWAEAGRWERFAYAAARHPITILFGYLTAFLWGMCLQPLLRKPRRHPDCLAAIVLHAALVATLAVFAPDVLAFTVLGPLFIGSALGAYLFYCQHNFPDASLKPRTEWTYVFASLWSSSYMEQGRLLHWITGNIGYHHVHHLNPRIPFYRLPEAMAALPELHAPGKTSLRVRDVWRCLRLKLWDPAQGRMVPFPAA